MTRTEAITVITNALQAVDDTTLEAAASHIAQVAQPSGITVGDIQEAFATESALSRPLTTREHDLVAQSKADFAAGRTYGTDEAFARIDAGLAARRAARAQA